MVDVEEKTENAENGGLQLAAVVLLAQSVDMDDIEALWQTGRYFDTVTSMLDPTRWILEHKGVESSMAVVQAFVAFRKVIDENAAR